jgi:hypothetical protein
MAGANFSSGHFWQEGHVGDSRPRLSAGRGPACRSRNFPCKLSNPRPFLSAGQALAALVPEQHGSTVSAPPGNLLCYNFLQLRLREKVFLQCRRRAQGVLR